MGIIICSTKPFTPSTDRNPDQQQVESLEKQIKSQELYLDELEGKILNLQTLPELRAAQAVMRAVSANFQIP